MSNTLPKKNLNNEMDDTWRRKGHIHEGKDVVPDVCEACGGFGFTEFKDGGDVECDVCGGEGYIYD